MILLIVGEATQQALLGEDYSVVHAAAVITTLLVLSRLFDYLSWRFDWFQRATESVPVVLVENGRPVADVLRGTECPRRTSSPPGVRPTGSSAWTRSSGR